MTREEARKAAEVMMAYAEGKDVEYSIKGYNNSWCITSTPAFNWETTKYRIKQEPTYRPFKDKDECWAEMQKHQPFGWTCGKHSMFYEQIMLVSNTGVYYNEELEYGYKELLKDVTFTDGTPFGIKEE